MTCPLGDTHTKGLLDGENCKRLISQVQLNHNLTKPYHVISETQVDRLILIRFGNFNYGSRILGLILTQLLKDYLETIEPPPITYGLKHTKRTVTCIRKKS